MSRFSSIVGKSLAAAIAFALAASSSVALARISNPPAASSAITAIGPTGQTSDGPTTTLATSTSATNGITSVITITGSGDTLTFTPSQSGTLTVPGGGSGAGTLTGILQGNGTSAFTAITGVIGQILFFNGTNTGQATSTIYVDSTSRVGIGSTTPQAKLSVNGNIVSQPLVPALADFDWSRSNSFATSSPANFTATFSNVVVGQCIRILTTVSGSAITITWPAAVTWGDAGAPTPDAANGGTDIFTFCSATSTATIHGRFAD